MRWRPTTRILIITQDDMSRGEVLRQHRICIDEGRASVLFGVASFAEGIDLPGKYLHHVSNHSLAFLCARRPYRGRFGRMGNSAWW